MEHLLSPLSHCFSRFKQPGAMKNVVIVGLGLSAAEAVKALVDKLPTEYRLVAITASEGYWPIASLRATVVPVSLIDRHGRDRLHADSRRTGVGG